MTTYHTGNPIGSKDPRDLYDNAENLDTFVNSKTKLMSPDRLGAPRKTYYGIEQDAQAVLDSAEAIRDNLGFFPPIDYESGLSVENTNFTVNHEGVVYAAQPGAVPFTTGAWDETKWYPIQNLLNQRNLLVFGTYAEASAAAATLPDGQRIDVMSEQKRYRTESGALVFVANLDQLRIDLASEYGYARGNLGKPYNIVGGALRRDTAMSPDWFIISDSAHLPIRLETVATDTVNLRLDYDGGKVGTFIAAPDETLAADGVSVGSSVGGEYSVISAGAPCSFTVDLDNANAITFSNRYFDASRFGVSVGATGLITITHPRRQLMQLPIVQHWAAGSYSENLRVHHLTPNGEGQSRFYLLERVRGRVAYVGSGAWGIGSSNWSTADCTFTWDGATGRLTVAHPATIGNYAPSVSALVGTTPLVCSLVSSSSSQFTVQLNKLDGGVPALTPAVGFFFDRGDVGIKKAPSGLIHAYLGVVKLNMAHVDSASGNIWTLGVHPSI